LASRAILEQMREDEKRHGNNALQQGAKELPLIIKQLMHIPAKMMVQVAYYF
jgi:3-demethoxyubiquinol 3-hydroxylase